MAEFAGDFLSGCVLGMSAGLSPGPLMSLVITEAVSSGVGAGVRVALAPLVTDAPIIAVCTLVLAQMARFADVLGALSLVGGCFILYMAWDAWRAQPPSGEGAQSRSMARGVITNFLSPHPYLFWMTVGSPILVAGWRGGMAGPVMFLAGFYGCLVGAKLVVATLAGRSRLLLAGRGYVFLLRTMGIALAVFALMFFRDGWQLLTVGNVS